MRIGFIGAGTVAQAIAAHALGSGHQVILSNSRGPETLRDLVSTLGSGATGGTPEQAAAADLVVLAVPWPAVRPALEQVADRTGCVLVDATNQFADGRSVPDELGDATGSDVVAALARGANVVKAFGTLSVNEGVSWATLRPDPHLVDWFDPEPGRPGRVLVVGCGYGDDAEWLAGQGYRVTAFDIAPTAVQRCRERFPASPVDYVVADLLEPPGGWLESRFDLVVEVYTLQVLPPLSDTRALAIRRLAELTGDRLLVIAHGRDESEDGGSMPWPVTRSELQPITKLGLTALSFEDYFDDEHPPVRRFRATYRRPSPSRNNGFPSRKAKTMTTRQTIDAFLDRVARRDADAAEELFAADIDWYVPGSDELPWTGRRNERAHVSEYFRTMWPHFAEGESIVNLDSVLVDGDDAVIFATFQHTVKQNGRSFTTPVAMWLHIEDGSITKMHLYEDTNAVRDAFTGLSLPTRD